jgi:hypothetical protein
MGIGSYFRGGRLARMSDGSHCIVRDLGPVKGGKGMKCHLTLLRLTPRGIASKFGEAIRHALRRADRFEPRFFARNASVHETLQSLRRTRSS